MLFSQLSIVIELVEIMNHSNITFISAAFHGVTSTPYATPQYEEIQSDDATWILTSAFIIFTMQSGFGLLEAGMVSKKNETNIMVKNAVDVIYGGLAYWLFGFGISFDRDNGTTAFNGCGKFFTDAGEDEMGHVFAKYFFHLSFSTTATTIVSGAMAERVELKAYILFSFINTLTYSLPAHWMWEPKGWLYKLDAVDVAGCSPVHIVGGFSGLVATPYLKPRLGKFDENNRPRPNMMASPTNVMLGMFMLWWGWPGFNCGSKRVWDHGRKKWKLASRIIAYKNKLLTDVFVTGIISGLVSITAICPVVTPWESVLIGFIGGAVGCFGNILLERMRIDDPVRCISTHGITGRWGIIVVGLVVERNPLMSKHYGVFEGGSWKFLGVQALTAVTIVTWTVITTFLELFAINKLTCLRMSGEKELDGADKWEHGIVANEGDDFSCLTFERGTLFSEEDTTRFPNSSSQHNSIQCQELVV
ncbi:putative ammonium transporter 3 [Stylophora pistillata]|uniref:putative ammonium transporter 3 n=1 Tax=Stylophora pistillata TaxID=50429 RepID=UPI000C05268D|nr:putative ammonium transporter 3 [Stylophora pistillata]